MPVLSLACHLPHNTPNIPSRYNNEQTTKQTKAINNSYIYIYISHVNVTQTVPDISPLMPMHQDPLLVSLLITTYLWRVDYVWLEKIMLIVINPLNCVQGRRICMKRSESFFKLVKKESWDLWVLWAKEVCSSNGYPMSWDHRMTSSNGNIFRVTGPLCGEFTGRRWIPLTKASDAELWCFLWSLSEWTVE